jgi:tetratricopeptide (TPR) repeat protein
VPLDRAAALRNAEKLLRQGKVDPAIAEYLRIVEDQPRDLNSTNTLGDLYIRAGQVEKAIEQYLRIAAILYDDGFLSKAGALYKKILKFKPDHEEALLQAGEVAANQGLMADARAYFKTVADRRRGRRDAKGVAQMTIRLGQLDPADFQLRMAAAAARVEIGEQSAALTDLKAFAGDLSDAGRHAEALEVLRQAALISPDDEEIRGRLLDLYVSAGDLARAREVAVTAAHFKALAGALDAQGSTEDGLAMLREAARLDPEDGELRDQLARTLVAQGNVEAATEYVTADGPGGDPQLQLVAAEQQLRAGRTDEGMGLIRRALEADPARRDDIAALGWKLTAELPGVAYQVVSLAAETAVVQTDWASAAAALQEYVTLVPDHIDALMRLVEICVDGGLEATMYTAQAQLADAYIAAGMGAEARFIAEDLVAREPWERANIERFRRALVLLGETDPDGVIAERLSGQTPFMSTDVITRAKFPSSDESAPAPATSADPVSADASPDAGIFDDDPLDLASLTGLDPMPEPPAPPGAAPQSEAADARQLDLGREPVDANAAFAELDAPAMAEPVTPKAYAAQDSVEVDLSIVIGEIGRGDADGQTRGAAGASPLQYDDLENVFEHLRGEASKLSVEGDEQLKRGMALRQAGKIDESIQAFELAARSPQHRFQAATLLGRTHRGRGNLPAAIEWFERAAQVPAPSEDEGQILLYELADALESTGEVARALSVCLELQSASPQFRDVATRVDRLSKVQTRG